MTSKLESAKQETFPFQSLRRWKRPVNDFKGNQDAIASFIQHPSNLIARIALFSKKLLMSVTTVQKRGRIVGLTAILLREKGTGTVRDYVEGVQRGHSPKQGKFLSDGQGLNPRHPEETKHLHIIQTHNLPVSKATVYRHAKLGYLTAKPIDFLGCHVQGTQKIQKK